MLNPLRLKGFRLNLDDIDVDVAGCTSSRITKWNQFGKGCGKWNAGIVPVPKQEPEPPKVKSEPKPPVEPNILTEIRPYDERDLVQQAEDETEDIEEEGDINKKT